MLAVLHEKAKPDGDTFNHTYDQARMQDYFKFCILRNPWERLVSCYLSKVLMFEKFEECWGRDFAFFVRYVSRHSLKSCDPHFRLQTRLIIPGEMDYVGRFEQYEACCSEIFQHIGVDAELPHENNSGTYDYRDYYTPDLMKKVGRIYAPDVRFGGYTFGS